MNTTNFLEQLAGEVRYSHNINQLASQQSLAMQQALTEKSISLVHDQFFDVGYLANPTDVCNHPGYDAHYLANPTDVFSQTDFNRTECAGL